MIKKIILCGVAISLLSCGSGDGFKSVDIPKEYEYKIDSLLSLMTLEEKIGQLNQYTGNWQATGPVVDNPYKIDHIKEGLVGSMLNIKTVERTRELQEYAMESRLKIPLLFGLDVIHGLRTIYPIPLGEAASFDLDLMQRTAAGAALEASAQGVHWTFAPMVDISRDARWGRVMEGAGEDVWYGSKVAAARVKGFQGESLSENNTIMACAKHFAAYGAVVAGKDYNSVDLSDISLHSDYLPPYKAAVDAGVGSFMNSFNDLNGIPATGNEYLQRTLLRKEWGFDGMTVSDWGSIGEMKAHGYVADDRGAAKEAILAGCDMDMEARAYLNNLKDLVDSGEVNIKYVDDAVKRILLKKFELGLFDDPFRYCDAEREEQYVLCDELKELSREAGRKSIVLMKNENQALPLSKSTKRIAVVGALATSQIDMMGFWANEGVESEVVTLLDGVKEKFSSSTVSYIEGYDLETNELKSVTTTVSQAALADVVVVAVGERYTNSGEAKSRADINISANHQLLVKELKKRCKKVVVVLMGGRPMIFNEMTPSSDAILLTWWLGTQAGNAIADVLAGDYNPSGRLPMTFPAHVGQIPIYYNYKNTGRPENKEINYSCRYQDIDFAPAYPFGYGLSYTTFEIGEPKASKLNYSMDEMIEVSVEVANVGGYAGRQTVQLYIRDMVASVTLPIKNLRAFQQVDLEVGETKEVVFELTKDDLGFVNRNLEYVTEPGEFMIMVGANAQELKSVLISLE